MPFPFSIPVMVVLKVIDGVDVGDPTVPAKPFEELTDTEVTEPPPFELNVFQSVADNNPRLALEAVGRFKVSDPPREAGDPLTLASVPVEPNVRPMVEFVNDELPILVIVLAAPEIVLLVSVCTSSRFVRTLVVPFALYLIRWEVELYQISPFESEDGSLAFPVRRISAFVEEAEKICLLPLV